MAREFIDIELEGEDKIMFALKRHEEHGQRMLRDMIDDIAEFAEDFLIGVVPIHSMYLLEHIDKSGPTWMPGGAGGGGEWKAVVGIKQGTSRHPIYVEFGTGIYAGTGLIWSTQGPGALTGKYAPVMTFQKRGEPRRFRYWIKGQRGQRYFYLTWRVAQAFAQARVLARKLI